MGALRDLITARIADIQSELLRAEEGYLALRARLEAQLGALEDAQGLINDRLEAQVVTLQRLGLLGPIKGK